MPILRQAAFTGSAPLLKGGLHCHTTRSDGVMEPEEVIRLHKCGGYDFLAITDHRLYNHRDFAPEACMTILPGMEMDRTVTGLFGHCFHTVSLGPALEDGNGFMQDQAFARGEVADQYEYQGVLDMLHANNNLTFYAHPGWSNTPVRAFENLRGDFALELWNTGCMLGSDMDTDNGALWDELLMQGKRLYGVAVDDGHAPYQYLKGWVRVNAVNRVSAILEALRTGAFYSSCGPEIYQFSIAGGVARVDCSPCRWVNFCYGRSPWRKFEDGGGLVTHAEFPVPDDFRYLRVTVMDESGCRAWTNPIFIHA
jgi:hypothetical protein